MKRKIIKAELLLTRKCNLKCSYCGIVRNFKEADNLSLWKVGLVKLKEELGCEFVPIYGAEPLVELERLCGILRICRDIGLKNSVITNALLIDNLVEKQLLDSGLDSITVSVDSIGKSKYIDRFALIKSSKGKEVLTKRFKGIRDKEASITITSANLEEIPGIVKYFTDRKVWTSMDVLHYSKGQEGSKCLSYKDMEWFIFKQGDQKKIEKVTEKLIRMKREGYLIHTSDKVFQLWLQGYAVKQNWVCKDISWLTIDADGSVFGCDDFQPEIMRGKYKVWNFDFEEFKKEWKENFTCKGCCWSTHVMSEEMIGQEDGGKYFRHEIETGEFVDKENRCIKV